MRSKQQRGRQAVTIRLRPETRAGIRLRQAMLAQKQVEVRALELELHDYIGRECGVDLRDGQWEMDPELVDLTRLPDGATRSGHP